MSPNVFDSNQFTPKSSAFGQRVPSLKDALNEYLHGKKTFKDFEQYVQLRKEINMRKVQ